MLRFIVVILGFSSIVMAKTFFVESAGGTYTPPEHAAAVTQLVKASVSELGHRLTRERSKANYVLLPKLIPIGRAYVVTLEKWKGSKKVFVSKLKAQRFENIDGVVRRLTRAVIKQVPVRDDVRVGEVTEEEAARGQRRRPARSGKYFALGPAGFGNLNTSSVAVYLAGAYAFDVNAAMIRIRADAAFGGGALFIDFGLGASFFLSDRDLAPFVGLDFGYGVARLNGGSLLGDSVSGFVLGPIIGVQLLRTSSINLEIAGRGAILLKSNSIGKPVMYTLRVGLYF